MTAPSRISVQGDTIAVYWRNESDAAHGYQTLRNVGDQRITGNELTMFAPATEKSMPGLYMPLLAGVDYDATLRLFGAPHEAVVAMNGAIARERAGNALGNLGIAQIAMDAAPQTVANVQNNDRGAALS